MFIWILPLVFGLLTAVNAVEIIKSKFYKLEHVSVCENDNELPMSTNGLTVSFDRNILNFHGSMELKEPLEGILEVRRVAM